MIAWLILGFLFLFFCAVVLRGAPYVPTHRRTITALFDELSLPPGATVVDIGSGDGVVLKMAAKRGYKAIGYEINPLLCAIAYIRCWRVRHQVTIRWRDFWLSQLPKADLLFVFSAGPFMRKLAQKITGVECLVASNGFAVPGWNVKKIIHGVYIYSLPSALQRGK